MQNPIDSARKSVAFRKTVAAMVAVLMVAVIFVGGVCAGVLYQKVTTDNAVAQVQSTCDARLVGLRDSNKQLRDLLESKLPPISDMLADMYSLLHTATSTARDAASQARTASETAKNAAKEAKTATATARKAATASTQAATATTQAAQKFEKAADTITDAITNPPPPKPPADVPDWLNTP
ncbi:hypothetical protein [Bradyrhizobium sp.]|uniref:hypothetical protein n=1 Tax=Bradyrhizobium sp. TaxID=376 RepID=UPI0039E25F93